MVLSSGTLDLLSFLLFYSFTFLLLNSFFTLLLFLLLKVLFTFLPLSTVSFVAFDGKAGAEWVCVENQSFVFAKSICYLRISTKKSEICKKIPLLKDGK